LAAALVRRGHSMAQERHLSDWSAGQELWLLKKKGALAELIQSVNLR